MLRRAETHLIRVAGCLLVVAVFVGSPCFYITIEFCWQSIGSERL